MRYWIAGCLAVLAAFGQPAGSAMAQSSTLDTVKARGQLQCGVNTGLAGFSAPDDAGQWKGLDVDMCRAVAAAIFKDVSKIKYVPLTAKERFTALQSGEIDMLARNTTWTMSRDTGAGLSFAGINYFDGQGFMVKKALDVVSAKELSGASICVQTGTTTELNLADYFRTNKIEYDPVVFEKLPEVLAAYNAGRCDAFTTDVSQLYSIRLTLGNAAEHIVLPEIISKEPLGPAVRQGDAQWANIVRWSLNAMINAEELGVTQANVDQLKESKNPEVRRLLGFEGEFGKSIGLDLDWSYQIIKLVGNYGESFDRNVGAGSPLGIARGQNALWRDGGLQYAPPIR
ncbi:MAG: amino acid ABC transporter substrate-binding protein [Alphaproteobacteria bacterium]|nr:amino acid ABC transporter substrate-binding protein [Alphaproteobacteria bacterium]